MAVNRIFALRANAEAEFCPKRLNTANNIRMELQNYCYHQRAKLRGCVWTRHEYGREAT